MQKEMSSEIKKIKHWIKKNDVLDVILFGSAVKAKSAPNDVDLCVLIKDRYEKKTLDLIDSLGKLTDKFNFEYHISSLVLSSFVTGDTLAKTLLSEGFSVLNNKPFSVVFGFKSKSLFVYTLKRFSPSKRVRFHYLLKGRYGMVGVLKEAKGELLGTGSLVVPTEKEDFLKEIFDAWTVKYKINRILSSE